MSQQIVDLVDKCENTPGKTYTKNQYEMVLEGSVIKLSHYGTQILEYDWDIEDVKAYSTSASDTASINTVLEEYSSPYRVKKVKGETLVYEV